MLLRRQAIMSGLKKVRPSGFGAGTWTGTWQEVTVGRLEGPKGTESVKL